MVNNCNHLLDLFINIDKHDVSDESDSCTWSPCISLFMAFMVNKVIELLIIYFSFLQDANCTLVSHLKLIICLIWSQAAVMLTVPQITSLHLL